LDATTGEPHDPSRIHDVAALALGQRGELMGRCMKCTLWCAFDALLD
jgi:hypothetical protein